MTNDNNNSANVYFYNSYGGHRKVLFTLDVSYLSARVNISNELTLAEADPLGVYGNVFETQDPLRAEHIAALAFVASHVNADSPRGPSNAKDQFILEEFGKTHHNRFLPETTLDNFNIGLKSGEIHVRNGGFLLG